MSTSMPRPVPQPEPTPAETDEVREATPAEATANEHVADEDAAADAPSNRAERRARAKGAQPSHVGPRAGRTGPGPSARSHTKRQLS